jgi:hypothetical protein
MKAVLRATCTTALALACVDGQAKTVDRCITTLAARPPSNATAAPAQRPCPTAIGYVPQRASAVRVASARYGSATYGWADIRPAAARHV